MNKEIGRIVRRAVLGGVALGCVVALAPQNANASGGDNSDRQGSDLLSFLPPRHKIFLQTDLQDYLAYIFSPDPLEVTYVKKFRLKKGAMYRRHGTGVAAGDGMLGKVSLFSSVAYSSVDDNFAGAKFDADIFSVSYGGDYAVTDKLIVGLAGGYADTDMDTKFNGGETDFSTWTIAPYVGYRISDYFGVDVSGGYSESDADNRRVAAGVRITSDQDSDAYFVSVNGRVAKWFGNIGVNGNIGYIYSKSESDNMTESNANFVAGAKDTFEQLEVGVRVSYYTERFIPYLSVAYPTAYPWLEHFANQP